MPIEGQVNNISDLNPVYPQSDDPVSQGDNHIRNIKKAVKDTFPNVDGPVNATDEELNQLAGNNVIGDISDLEGRVSQNETDISKNASDINSNAADIATNAAGIATNTANIATNAGNIASNDQDIASLDSRVEALENAPTAGLIPHSINDHTDVNTSGAQEGYVLAYVGGNWVPMKPSSGGGMIKPTQQPRFAGDFQYYSYESAYLSGVRTGGTVTLQVPAGKIFSLEYIAAYGQPSCSIDPDSIEIDGIKISGGSNYNKDLEYTSSGGPTWPGNEGFNPIRVESTITVPITSGTGQIYISGMFSED